MSTPVFFTMTYGPDLQNTRQLLSSLQRVGSDLRHVVVVDDADREAALCLLKGFKVEVIPTSAVLPPTLQAIFPGAAKLRAVSARGQWAAATARAGLRLARAALGPLNGWWMQQVAKLAICDLEPTTTFVIVDSDQVFVRTPTPDWFIESNGTPKLFHRPAPSLKEVTWKLRAHGLYGIDRFADSPSIFTVTPQVVDSRLTLDMRRHIEACRMGPWWRTMLANQITEYELYGCYAAHVAKSGSVSLEACPWSVEVSPWRPKESLEELSRRVSDEPAGIRVVCVQSKLPGEARAMATEVIRPLVERN